MNQYLEIGFMTIVTEPSHLKVMSETCWWAVTGRYGSLDFILFPSHSTLLKNKRSSIISQLSLGL